MPHSLSFRILGKTTATGIALPLAFCACLSLGGEQEAPSATGMESAPEAAAAHALMKRLASEIDMLGVRDDGTRYRADLVPYSLMQIHDPARGRSGNSTHSGNLWAWTAGGRPIAVAEIWRWNRERDRWGHALVSTTPGQVMAEVDGRTWRPTGPGLEFHPVRGVSAPAAVSGDRARQARQLAKDFTGFEVYRGERIDLDLRPQPIYRYHSGGIDGSVFALTHFDNPEALLFIEAVADPLEPSSWRYGVAQVSSHELHVEYQGQEVVEIPEATEYVGSPSSPFWVFYVRERLDQPGSAPEDRTGFTAGEAPQEAAQEGNTPQPPNSPLLEDGAEPYPDE